MDSPDFLPDTATALPTPPGEEQDVSSCARTGSAWISDVSALPIDPIFLLNDAYAQDVHPDKVNLGMGVYRSDAGLSWPLPSVISAEAELASLGDLRRHDYLPDRGDPRFLTLARDLILGEPTHTASSVISVQTLSGTGANHVGAMFLSEHLRPSAVWLSDPTWQNHHTIWEQAGVKRKIYPYFDSLNKRFDFQRAMQAFEAQLRQGDVIVLQACAHNPTGQDPAPSEWKAIAELCHRKQALPFFDCAYQGFASGDPFQDSWAVRYFHSTYPHMPMFVAQSFSKNFGLYGQRTGALHFAAGSISESTQASVRSNLCHIARSEYSFAPRLGSSLVGTILGNEEMRQQWLEDLKTMSARIQGMRVALHSELRKLKTPGTWDHIVSQIGMFSYTGLTAPEAADLRFNYHIYLLDSGRISISGLTTENVAYVAKAFDKVVRRHRCHPK